MNKELLVFIRNPKLGKVKTRLAKGIGEEKALEIYNILLNHTAAVCRKLDIPVRICFSDQPELHPRWDHPNFHLEQQRGSDLGERMQNALQASLNRGVQKAILIGSDLYDLSPEIIGQAIESLDKNEVVIGPATDGGYYLVGLKKIPPQLFQKKTWGGPSVLQQTMESLEGYDVALLNELNDVDTLDDLRQHPELMNLLK